MTGLGPQGPAAGDRSGMPGRVRRHLLRLYPHLVTDALVEQVISAIGLGGSDPDRSQGRPLWDETDAILITYGDSIIGGGDHPLSTLARFVRDHLDEAISTVHVLPFAPSSSDRGFAVIDYGVVDPAIGDWADLDKLAGHADLMVDVVINHVSGESAWFRDFIDDLEPGRSFFIRCDPDADYSAVVRPRPSPLTERFETTAGPADVWCTFSRDQVDLDFRNPAVLIAMLHVVDRFVETGARFLRLDAIAFLWKDLGTSCVHLPQTHEIVRLLHSLLAVRSPRTAIITETNVPNAENLSYFGDGDEAHIVYNFPAPPLIIDALLNERSDRLTTWVHGQPEPPSGCTYLNFLSSHDGIGLRPALGILSAGEIDRLVEICHQRGGLHGTYSTPDGERPYELNIALYDLLDAASDGGVARYLCAHTIMLGLQGIPAVYLNSLVGSANDRSTVGSTGVTRDINRARLDDGELRSLLADASAEQSRIFAGLIERLRIRRQHDAFRPETPQVVVDLGPALFALRRGSILAIHNVTGSRQGLAVKGRDLLNENRPAPLDLDPYQCVWLVDD